MKQYTISTLHRTLASVLLFSQLLTSCGGAEMIAPACTTPQTHQHMELSDENPISASSIGSPTPLVTLDEQEYASDDSVDSFNSLPTYTTRQSHKIEFVQEGDQYVARVQEQLPLGFKSAPHILPVYIQQGFFPEDLTPDAYVDVVFPRKANGNKGYVFCAEHRGLLGGGEGGSKSSSDGCAYRANERVWNNDRGCYTCPGRGQHPRSAPTASSSSSSSYRPRPSSPHSHRVWSNSNSGMNSINTDRAFTEITRIIESDCQRAAEKEKREVEAFPLFFQRASSELRNDKSFVIGIVRSCL